MKEIIVTLKSGEQIAIRATPHPYTQQDGGILAAIISRQVATEKVLELLTRHTLDGAFPVAPRLEEIR